MRLVRSQEDIKDWRVAERIPKRIKVREMSEPFSVLTQTGWVQGRAGDFVSVDESGRLSVIPGAIVESYYRILPPWLK